MMQNRIHTVQRSIDASRKLTELFTEILSGSSYENEKKLNSGGGYRAFDCDLVIANSSKVIENIYTHAMHH
jgi:hypothetical protein